MPINLWTKIREYELARRLADKAEEDYNAAKARAQSALKTLEVTQAVLELALSCHRDLTISAHDDRCQDIGYSIDDCGRLGRRPIRPAFLVEEEADLDQVVLLPAEAVTDYQEQSA